MPTQFTRLIILVTLSSMAARSQRVGVPFTAAERQRVSELMRNTAMLSVSLSLNRTSYFPSENAVLRMTVANNGKVPMEAFDIWDRRAAVLTLSAAIHDRLPVDPRRVPSRQFAVGENQTREFHLDGSECSADNKTSLLSGSVCTLPWSPGKHAVFLLLFDESSPFEGTTFDISNPSSMVAAEVQMGEWIRPSHDALGRLDGREIRHKTFARVYRLERDGEQWLCVVRHGLTASLEESERQRIPHLRNGLVCTHSSKSTIENLSLERGPDESIAIRFTEAGKDMRIRLDRNRKRLEKQ